MTSRSGLSLAVRNAVIAAVPQPALARMVSTCYRRIEPELTRLGAIMPRGGTALDVGAWLGPWSRRMLRFADRVVAIEAHPQLAALLTRTDSRLTVVHAAASDTTGQVLLRIPPGGPSIGISSVATGDRAGSVARDGDHVLVPQRTIDELDLDDVRFVKMDIEGHEYAALLGARQTIARDRPVLLVEMEERMQPVAPTVELLRSWGYAGFVLPDRHWVPLADFDLVEHQRQTIKRVDQSFARRLIWPRPRYVNMVLFRPEL
jgi:FkbM family methyltransferase